MRRRGWIIASVLAVAAIAWLADALWFEPESTTVTALDVAVPSWPANTAPVRAVFLADIHIDPVHMTPKRVNDIVARANALRPDIILLGGDYIGGDWLTLHRSRKREVRDAAENAREQQGLAALGSLNAPLGVYAVLGNHDCWWSCDDTRDALTAQHIQVLDNSSARIARAGGDLWLEGLQNKTTGHPDFAKAMQGVPAGVAEVTMIHEPDPFVKGPAAATGLVLAGHTHAGQVRFPLIGAPVRNSRYLEETAKGWLLRGNRILIVTRGLGESGLPIRFGAPPQIMVLTLHPGPVAKVTPSKP